MAEQAFDFQNHILHTRAQSYHWEGVGPLSIKTFSGGRAIYTVGHGCHAVDESSYLILNHEQPYAITIDSDSPVESFCLFFNPDLASDVYHSAVTGNDKLLDEIEAISIPIHFFEKIYQHDEILSPELNKLRNANANMIRDRNWVVEQMHSIMIRLLQVHRHTLHDVAAMPAMRPSTREELYRRIYAARDYIVACYDQPITLNEIARIACLSPNHLLRVFKHTFKTSPHRYLTEIRLSHARKLLIRTDRSITDICFDVGFESPGSFSWLFRQHTGASPRTYRWQNR